MPAVADVIRRFAPAYLNQSDKRVPAAHRAVIRSIIACRTESLGTLHYECSECKSTFNLYRSCGNRHCPTCGGAKNQAWLTERIDRLLPVPHFMITFTVPSVLRPFFLHHQRECYGAFFTASSSVLSRLASEDTWFPGDTPGFFGVLHTWGRTLQYHPHIHYIVPGGAFNRETHRWHHSPKAFFVPVRILSRLVKQRFFSLIRSTGLLRDLPPDAFHQDWNVDSRPVGTGRRALKYLSAYVFRTAICDKRIVTISDEAVTFRYTDSRSGQAKLMSLDPMEFIRRFLQHVLPPGFMKIRYYGFLHPASRMPLALAAALLEAFADVRAAVRRTARTAGPFCPRCNAPGHFLRFSPRPVIVLKPGFT
jgi:hypothetical protein